MKCQECVNEGKTSCVYSHGTTTTCMSIQHYFDEEGREHWHDPNSSSSHYSCSNGHRFSIGSKSECQACKLKHEAGDEVKRG